jgi:hypothetical protein
MAGGRARGDRASRSRLAYYPALALRVSRVVKDHTFEEAVTRLRDAVGLEDWRPGASRVRRRHDRYVDARSRKNCSGVSPITKSLRHQTGRPDPLRPQPPPRRCAVPASVRRPQESPGAHTLYDRQRAVVRRTCAWGVVQRGEPLQGVTQGRLAQQANP